MRRIWATDTETKSVFNNAKTAADYFDGVPYRNWVRLFGNLEGWVKSGDAQRFKMSSVCPAPLHPVMPQSTLAFRHRCMG